MAWACAVCIDLTCVMAARERQRDRRTRQHQGRLSWPTLVLIGGILLSLAANLAQAQRSVWGWIVAGTPAAAFLVAVSMLERRASARPGRPDLPSPSPSSTSGDPSSMPVPPSFGTVPADRKAAVEPVPAISRDATPELTACHSEPAPDSDRRATDPTPKTDQAGPLTPGPLLDFARRVAEEHHTTHGRPITRDALRARLGVSNQLASELLRQIRNQVPA
jgi:hypothetical protein